MSVKSSMRKFGRMSFWKKALCIGLSIITIGGSIFGVTKLVQYIKDDTVTVNPSWSIGSLDAQGEYVKDEGSIYSDSFGCDGLKIKLDFDHEIEYQVYYYDEVGNFLQASEVMNEGFNGDVLGSNARIVITPTEDEDGKISWYEKQGYANQMTITVSKKQVPYTLRLGGKDLYTVKNPFELVFNYGDYDEVNDAFVETEAMSITSEQLLVRGDFSKVILNPEEASYHGVKIYEFSCKDNKLIFLEVNELETERGATTSVEQKLNADTDYVLLTFYKNLNGSGMDSGMEMDASFLKEAMEYIVIK